MLWMNSEGLRDCGLSATRGNGLRSSPLFLMKSTLPIWVRFWTNRELLSGQDITVHNLSCEGLKFLQQQEFLYRFTITNMTLTGLQRLSPMPSLSFNH